MTAEFGPWVAVINWGRWLGECPRPRCSNAVPLEPGQGVSLCIGEDGCGYAAPVEWPAAAAELTAELQNRPIKADRNWAPKGHRQTYQSKTPNGRVVAEAFPNGQTLADLQAENRELETLPPAASDPEDVMVRANAVLAEMGFQLDPGQPDRLRRI